MLTRFHKILIGLLVAQLALAALAWLRAGDAPPLRDQPLLAGLDVAKVASIKVFGDSASKPAIELAKQAAGWSLVSHFGYPADAAKVKAALDPIAKIAAGAPLATAASRHKQLRVADGEFDRKIVLGLEGGGERVLYTGSPAGGRRTAVRVGGVEVFAAKDVPFFATEPTSYVATKYFEVPRAEITKLTIQRDQRTFVLTRSAAPPAGSAAPPAGSAAPPAGSAAPPAGSAAPPAGSAAPPAGSAAPPESSPAPETWDVTVDGSALTLAAGEAIDREAIDSLLADLSAIELRAPGDPKRDASRPTATVAIERKGATEPIVLEVVAEPPAAPAAAGAPAPEAMYWVRKRGDARAALVELRAVNTVVEIAIDKLVKKPAPPAAGSASAPAAGSAAAALPPGMAPAPGGAGAL
jgi:hypothetical protein